MYTETRHRFGANDLTSLAFIGFRQGSPFDFTRKKSTRSSRLPVTALFNTGGFTASLTQIVQTGASHLAKGDDFDLFETG